MFDALIVSGIIVDEEVEEEVKGRAFRKIPHMTKSHHGGNMSIMIKVGMCQRQNPTIQYKVQVGPVGSGKLFNMPPVLRQNI